jgi:hypothetical protein
MTSTNKQRSGSAASGVMSWFSFVPAGGLYATAQSAAMGGYGASVAAGTAQAGAMFTSSATAVSGWWRKKGGDEDCGVEKDKTDCSVGNGKTD